MKHLINHTTKCFGLIFLTSVALMFSCNSKLDKKSKSSSGENDATNGTGMSGALIAPFDVPNSATVKPDSIYYFSGSASEIGTQYGQQLGEDMQELIDGWLKPHVRMVPLLGSWYTKKKTRELLIELPNSITEEVEAIAKSAPGGIEVKDLYAANFASDILQFAARPLGCSTFIVTPERSSTGGMLYGRNLDYYKSDILRQYWKTIVFARTGMKKVLVIGVPGHTGVMTGINEAGVMMSVLVSFTQEKYTTDGIASLMLFRLVLERAESAEHARELYIGYKRTVPVNVVIADGNKSLVLEAGVKKHATRYPTPSGTLYAANHFESAELAFKKHTRDERWKSLSRYDEGSDKLGFDAVKGILADAARDNPAYIAQNILSVVVDFANERIIFGSDGPVAIEGRLYELNYREVFNRSE